MGALKRRPPPHPTPPPPQVHDPKDAFYKLTNSHTQISSYVFDVVRARCGPAPGPCLAPLRPAAQPRTALPAG
jgi:hypothetical protein